jgi:hypothetical protein
VSEKMIAQQQAGLIRRVKTSCGIPADFAGTRSGVRFVVSRAGEAYDAQNRGPIGNPG